MPYPSHIVATYLRNKQTHLTHLLCLNTHKLTRFIISQKKLTKILQTRTLSTLKADFVGRMDTTDTNIFHHHH